MAAAASVSVRVDGMGPLKDLVDGARQMDLYYDAGGDGWWAGWDKIRRAVRHMDGGQAPAPRVTDPGPEADLEHARRRAAVAEQALTELHEFVRDQLDPDPGEWDEYHTCPDARALVQRLQRDAGRAADRAAAERAAERAAQADGAASDADPPPGLPPAPPPAPDPEPGES